MTNFIKIYTPKNTTDFQKGIILLDEAVYRFGLSDDEHGDTLHRIIAAIVREFDGCEDDDIDEDDEDIK
jgi:hypothetical protein